MRLRRKQMYLVAFMAMLTLVAWSWWYLAVRQEDRPPHGATIVRLELTDEEVRHGASSESLRASG